jgi:P27 family predicted phage terminase small subunit
MKPGRKKTPDSILKARGSWRAGSGDERGLHQLEPLKKLPRKPERFKGDVAKFYKRIGKQLIDRQVMTELDITAFEMMVDWYGSYLQAEEAVKEHGMIIKTEKGKLYENPACKISRQCLNIIKDLMVKFGMTPNSREDVKKIAENDPESSKYFPDKYKFDPSDSG